MSSDGESTPVFLAEALGDIDVPGSRSDFAAAISQRKGNVLRCRRGIQTEGFPVEVAAVPWYRLGFRRLLDHPPPSQWWAFAMGDFYLQDAGSLLALAASAADTELLRDWTVCDLCAAPGGKASALVEAMDIAGQPGRGFVLANEPIRSRLPALQWNLARTGSDRYAVSALDPNDLANRLPQAFDFVLVDAPCSGQALLGRGKQSLSALSKKQIDHSAARQRRIMDAATRLLRPGGLLVYSTCTFSMAENESQVRHLLQTGQVEPNPVQQLQAYQSDPGCYRLWPHLHRCAGSFAASMRVIQTTASSSGDRSKRNRRKTPRDRSPPVDLSQWYDVIDGSLRLFQTDSTLIGWPHDAPSWAEAIAVHGPELAHRTGQTWKPAHAGALRRVDRALSLQGLDLDDEAANTFMRGEPVASPIRGWHVVKRNGRPLGWAKGNGSIAKNHLPPAARATVDRCFV